ncbi:MAG: hypothetical protein HON53_16220 [Planctomycetaceae bacterium]|jgi:hypothetical protein|nr:hypothetical protein [Planctomycetaceae bacterium]MBT6156031.1 hypothetical protein [Planctomycetaceae bacterium]MBT6487528.1 hypothetical protein [Planctomycetaceae bacterium]MBT6495845.1 hypothetical protein [Planctomycetaceae bacterium]
MAAPSILPSVWKVPQVFRDRLGTKAGRQRTMVADGHLLLVLHAPPGADDDDRKGRFFWRQPDGKWSSAAFGSGPGALKKHLGEYTALLVAREEQDEDAVSAKDYFAVISTLAPIKRSARHQHEVLQEARQICPEDRDLISLRDQAYQIERMSELLYDDAKNGLDFSMAIQSEAQARSSHRMSVAAHRLNVLAGFFFPIATLTTVFGVNLDHGFEHKYQPIPFLVCAGVGLMAGLIINAVLRREPADEPA